MIFVGFIGISNSISSTPTTPFMVLLTLNDSTFTLANLLGINRTVSTRARLASSMGSKSSLIAVLSPGDSANRPLAKAYEVLLFSASYATIMPTCSTRSTSLPSYLIVIWCCFLFQSKIGVTSNTHLL